MEEKKEKKNYSDTKSRENCYQFYVGFVIVTDHRFFIYLLFHLIRVDILSARSASSVYQTANWANLDLISVVDSFLILFFFFFLFLFSFSFHFLFIFLSFIVSLFVCCCTSVFFYSFFFLFFFFSLFFVFLFHHVISK